MRNHFRLLVCLAVISIVIESNPVWMAKPTRKTHAPKANKSRVTIRRKSAAAVAFVAKKREESPSRLSCPSEYSSCSCEFMSPDQLNTKYDRYEYGGARTRNRIGKSTYQSIVIDCQIGENLKRPTLKEIPKLVKTTGSGSDLMAANVSKYFKHVTHLDLSRTAITHVPTEAFLGLTGLQTIVINNCKYLTRIDRFAFRNLPNLRTLLISNNPSLIRLEPHSFGSLFNLDYLSLVMNNLTEIEGYIFSVSKSIRIIDFIGNPIKRIKSHAFHGLQNVSDLFLSLIQNKSPIELIEGDSFITTAFVDQIHLEGIPAKHLATHAFRGLSHVKSLLLTHTHIEQIHAGAFIHANNIKRLSLMNSRVRNVSRDAFRDVFNIDVIDLRGNYLTNASADTFESLIAASEHDLHHARMSADANSNQYSSQSSSMTTSVVFIDTARANRFVVRKILFGQNPIQCDCSLVWILSNPAYRGAVSLPELCAGPKGYDCLRISDLDSGELICPNNSKSPLTRTIPCDDLVFDVDKNIEIYSISAPKGKKKIKSPNQQEDDDIEYDDKSDEYETQSDRDYSTTTTTTVNPVVRSKHKSVETDPGTTVRVIKNPHNNGEAVKASTSPVVTLNNANSLRFSFIVNSGIFILLFSFRLFFEDFACL